MNTFDNQEINGELLLPGVVADIVAKKDSFVTIYGDSTGRTRDALRQLREYGGGHVVVHAPGEPGTKSRSYWNKMLAEGLVGSMEDANGQTVRLVTQHHDDLVNSFIFAAFAEHGATEDARRVANQNLAYARKQCELAIDQGVGCGNYQGSVLTQFLRRQDWLRQEVGRDLWGQYVASGLIKPNERVPYQEAVTQITDKDPSYRESIGLIHPLEAAIINGNLDSLRALMESGADECQVPTRDWSQTENTRSKDGPITDIHSFIRAKVPNPALGPLMSAFITEVTMNRRINAGQVAPVEVPSPRRGHRTL